MNENDNPTLHRASGETENPTSPSPLGPDGLPAPGGRWFDFWSNFVASNNAPNGTLFVVGISDPSLYLHQPPASEVGLPEGFRSCRG